MPLLLKIRHLSEALFAYAIIGLFRLLGLRLGGRLAAALMRGLGPLNRVHKVLLGNLRAAFPGKSEKDIKVLAGQCWDNAGRTFSEYANLDKLRKRHEHHLTIHGAEKARQAVKDGRGLILVSGHIGNWESMSMAIDLTGLDAAGVYRHANNPIMNRWMIDKRRASVIPEQYPKGAKGTKFLIKKLKAGGTVCMLVDQKMNDGIEVRLFGRKAMTPSGAASMARRYNVPLMLITNNRVGATRFNVTFHDAFEADQTDDVAKDIQTTTQKINDFLEAAIREHPAQWLWMHNRWS